jgi:hypothetical protein
LARKLLAAVIKSFECCSLSGSDKGGSDSAEDGGVVVCDCEREVIDCGEVLELTTVFTVNQLVFK